MRELEVTSLEYDPWTRSGSEKRTAVQGIFGEIAPTYDRVNSLLSLRLHHRWRRIAVAALGLREGDSVLDCCCGTGDFFAPIRQAIGSRGQLVACDFSLPMLEHSRSKPSPSMLVLGDAVELPVAASVFDAVTVGWGIRNVPDIDLAHREAFRVLKSGGRFVSLDMAQPRSALLRRISGFIFSTVSPFVGRIFGHTKAYTYLPKSTERFWSRERLSESMIDAGFVSIQVRDLFFGNICFHVGRKP